MSILDQVARLSASVRRNVFRPKTTVEFFALRLAHKLGEATAAAHYLDLLEHCSESHMITAYRRTVASKPGDLARRFHSELEPFLHRDGDNGNGISRPRLAAIRVDRRAVAVAIFNGDHLEYAQPRQLAASPERAVISAVNFIGRIMDRFSFASATMEVIPNGHEVQRTFLQRAMIEALTARPISTMKVSKRELFKAFGFPVLRSRKELRQAASEIWPALDVQPGGPWTHDAAMLGLYVQTERLFAIN